MQLTRTRRSLPPGGGRSQTWNGAQFNGPRIPPRGRDAAAVRRTLCPELCMDQSWQRLPWRLCKRRHVAPSPTLSGALKSCFELPRAGLIARFTPTASSAWGCRSGQGWGTASQAVCCPYDAVAPSHSHSMSSWYNGATAPPSAPPLSARGASARCSGLSLPVKRLPGVSPASTTCWDRPTRCSWPQASPPPLLPPPQATTALAAPPPPPSATPSCTMTSGAAPAVTASL